MTPDISAIEARVKPDVVEFDERMRCLIATNREGEDEYGASAIVASEVELNFGRRVVQALEANDQLAQQLREERAENTKLAAVVDALLDGIDNADEAGIEWPPDDDFLDALVAARALAAALATQDKAEPE